MSKPSFYHLLSGVYLNFLDDRNIKAIQEVIDSVKPAFEGTTNFTLEFYLQQLANAPSVDIVKGILAPFWTDRDVPMDNLFQALQALNLLIKTFDDNKVDMFHLKQPGDGVHVYIRKRREEEFDSESLADELSAASEKELTKELKLAEKKFSEKKFSEKVLVEHVVLSDSNEEERKDVENVIQVDDKDSIVGKIIADDTELDTTQVAIGKFSNPTTMMPVTPNPWKTVPKSISKSAPLQPFTVMDAPVVLEPKARSNVWSAFSDDDDEDDDVDEIDKDNILEDSAFMQQSLDSAALASSPDSKQKRRLTQMEKLANRTDRNLRAKGWATISRHLEKGDPNAIGIEDLCYYICHSSTNLRKNKKDHIVDYSQSLVNHRKQGESTFKTNCEKIVDKSISTLMTEDAAIFNKIRINKNDLDTNIVSAKNHIKRLVELSQITNTVAVDVDTRVGNLTELLDKAEKIQQAMPTPVSNDDRIAALVARIDAQESRIKVLESRASNPDDDNLSEKVENRTSSSVAPVPDKIDSTSQYCQFISPKPQADSMLNTLQYPPYQYMSRIQLRHALMQSITGWLMSYTVREGQYFYHISTMRGTDMFAYHSDIVDIKEVGEPNNFLYGYNPTRNMSIFNTPAALRHTQVATTNSPTRNIAMPSVPPDPQFSPSVQPAGDPSPSPTAPGVHTRLYQHDASSHDDDDLDSRNAADDDRSVRQNQHRGYHQRPLLNNEYSYPIGSAITKIREDKIEDLHSSIKIVLSDTASIRQFYEDLRRRLKAHHVPLREWNSLAPNVDVLDIQPNLCANYGPARIVMSRAIFNLLDANKDTLITDLYMRGELTMYDEKSDGLAFLSYMVSQNHPKYRHQVVQPSIAASLKIPTFDDDITLHEFCSNVKEYLDNGLAPDHFTPFAAAQYVLEALRTDSRFTTGCAYLQTEVNQHNNKTGWAPQHLQLHYLPRTILNQYEASMKSELSKPRRLNARRVEVPSDDQGLVINRAFTRSNAREGRDKGKTNEDKRDNRNRDTNRKSGDNRDSGKDLPFIQCPCCGKPGHDECDCRQKGSFVKLSQWYELLTKAQRRDIIAEMNKNARATHERYKAAYGKRRAVRKRINRVADDSREDGDLDIAVEKNIILQACRAQMPDLDFGSLDYEFDDDIEPYLEFDPAIDSAEYESRS